MAYVWRAYCIAIETAFGVLTAEAEQKAPEECNNDGLEGHLKLSTQLFYTLTLILKDAALAKIKTCPEGEVFRAWSTLAAQYDPRIQSRFTGKLMSLVTTEFNDQQPLEPKLDLFDRKVREYKEQSGDKLSGKTLAGVVIKGIQDKGLQKHFLKKAARLQEY